MFLQQMSKLRVKDIDKLLPSPPNRITENESFYMNVLRKNS